MIIFSSRLIKLASDNQDDENIIISVNMDRLVERLNKVVTHTEPVNPDNTIFITVSGAKTSDFVSIVQGSEYINFGERFYLGYWEIVDDTTINWRTDNGLWNALTLSKIKMVVNDKTPIRFLVKGYLKDKTVELF